MDGPTTTQRCIDALDRIDQNAKKAMDLSHQWDYVGDMQAVRHSVEALTWVLQNTAVSAEKLEVFVAAMCEAYGVEGP